MIDYLNNLFKQIIEVTLNTLSVLLETMAILILFALFSNIFDSIMSKENKVNWRFQGIFLAIALAFLGLKYFVVDNYAEITDRNYRTAYYNLSKYENADLAKLAQAAVADNKITKNEYADIKNFAKSNGFDFSSLPSDAVLNLNGAEITPILLDDLTPTSMYIFEGFGKSSLWFGLLLSLCLFTVAFIRYKNASPEKSSLGLFLIGLFFVACFFGGNYYRSIAGNGYSKEINQFIEANKGISEIDQLNTAIKESKNISSADMVNILEMPAQIEKNTIIERLKKST